MPTRRKPNYAQRLHSWAGEHGVDRIERIHFNELLADLAPVTEVTLRKTLRQSGIPLAALVEGVRQDTLDNLQRTLTALADEYTINPHEARAQVLVARQHAEWNLRRHPDEEQKREALSWLRTWLENPVVFPAWCKLRRQALPEPRA